MSSEIAEMTSAMEFAARRGLREFVHDNGRCRIGLWRDTPQDEAKVAGDDATAATRHVAENAADSATAKAPLSGVCHLAQDPGSPPFVTAGDSIEAGQIICIIEAMKVMTAVPAPHGGTVGKIHVANGSTVSADDPLMDISA